MFKTLKKSAKRAGLPPGALVNTDSTRSTACISLIQYDSHTFEEHQNLSPEASVQQLNQDLSNWIHVQNSHDTHAISFLGEHFHIHPLAQEDILISGQRSKLDDYKDFLFIVIRMLRYQETTDSIEDEQVSLVLGPNFLLSFVEADQDVFDPVRQRLRKESSRIRTLGIDYLCYALIDCIVDNYFLILEKIDEKLDKLEEEVIKASKTVTITRLQKSKRDMIMLRKSIWPLREVINQFRKSETPLVSESTKLYLHDVYDHTIQTIDTIESFRDIASSMLEIYISTLSQKLNEIMKVLTVVSTIFVPLTFIASIFGMNFKHMPELEWKWSYPLTLFVMACLACGMMVYFRRKKWI